MLEESLGLVDNIVKAPSVIKSELLGLLDTIEKGVGLHPLTETLGLLDTYDRTWAAHKNYTESLGLDDRLSKHLSKALVEVLGLLDSISYSKNPTVLAKLIAKFIQLENIGGGGER
ncbi:unnamed protein product [marine sediment metagenome]|uniref:Uncharacterized protein n=1 Tax=marine sediment metagenome TaxID=412755 RepID=X1UDI7_9ZZZZ